MASAIAIHALGMKLLNTTGYSKNAALAGNLAADTLRQINALIGDEKHNGESSDGATHQKGTNAK